MTARIHRASGRAKCGVCKQIIAKGELQIAINGFRDSMNIHGSNVVCNKYIKGITHKSFWGKDKAYEEVK